MSRSHLTENVLLLLTSLWIEFTTVPRTLFAKISCVPYSVIFHRKSQSCFVLSSLNHCFTVIVPIVQITIWDPFEATVFYNIILAPGRRNICEIWFLQMLIWKKTVHKSTSISSSFLNLLQIWFHTELYLSLVNLKKRGNYHGTLFRVITVKDLPLELSANFS